jgi:hypothetical protein
VWPDSFNDVYEVFIDGKGRIRGGWSLIALLGISLVVAIVSAMPIVT